jgi:hypothetical protein
MGPEPGFDLDDDYDYPLYPNKITCWECGNQFFVDEYIQIPFCKDSCRDSLAYHVWRLKHHGETGEQACET